METKRKEKLNYTTVISNEKWKKKATVHYVNHLRKLEKEK